MSLKENDNIIEKLPDELLLHILTYCVSDPTTIVQLSHINKRMESLLNSSPMIVSNMINENSSPPESMSIRLMVGCMISGFWEDPIGNGIRLIKQFVMGLFQARAGYGEEESKLTKYHQVKQYVNSKERIVNCLKLARRDWSFRTTINKIEKYLKAFRRKYFESFFFMVATTISFTIQCIYGKIGTTPFDQWTLDKGLWWIPYAFWPLEGIIIGFILFSILVSMFYSIKAMRLLIIHPRRGIPYKEAYNIFTVPILSVFYTLMGRCLLIFLRFHIHSMVGFEISFTEWIASIICYYTYYPTLLCLTIYFFSSIEKFVNRTPNIDQFFSIALSTSIALLRLGYLSYLTLAPITTVMMGLLIKSLRQTKRRPLRKFN